MNQGGSGELELRGLCKAYGSFNAVDGVDLRVREGEFVSLLRPERLREDHHPQDGGWFARAR